MIPPSTIPARLALRCAALAALVLGGCNIVPPAQDDATRYFVLSDAAPPADAATAPAAAGLRIGLKSLHLESYLKDRPMVIRSGANEVQFEDFRRWAEPLESGITRALRQGLLAAPGISQVSREPFPFDQARDYDVSVEVTRFEGSVSAGKYGATMSAVIEISTPGANSQVISRKVFEAQPQAWDGSDFGRLAVLLSADVEALAREVAAELPPKG